MTSDILTVESAAALLHVSQDHLRELARTGKVPAAKPGKSWVFRSSKLLAWLDAEPAGEKVRDNVWEYLVGAAGGEVSTGHPAVFPFDLARDHVATWTNPGDLVLDPFMGSGTTAQVAQALGRQWIGCELNDDYAAMQAQRTAQACFAI